MVMANTNTVAADNGNNQRKVRKLFVMAENSKSKAFLFTSSDFSVTNNFTLVTTILTAWQCSCLGLSVFRDQFRVIRWILYYILLPWNLCKM